MLHTFLLHRIVLSVSVCVSHSVSFSPVCVHMYLHVHDFCKFNFPPKLGKLWGLCFGVGIHLHNNFKVMLVLKSQSSHFIQQCSLPMWSQFSMHLYPLGML